MFSGGRVVVIGGGVIGLSIAYHLVRKEHVDVTLVEKGALGSGTTSKGTGAIRQQFSSIVNARVAQESVAYFEQFEDIVGEPFEFRQHGYLFTIASPETLGSASVAVAMQQGLGIPSQILSAGGVAALQPYVRADDLVGGAYCATDGSGDPGELARAFARQARLRGADIREYCAVTSIRRRDDGTVFAIATDNGDIEADAVVIAAGPWSAAVGALAGVSIPVRPTPRQAFALARDTWPTVGLPMTVDLDTGAYVQPKPSGGVVGGTDRLTKPGFEDNVDDERREQLMRALAYRFPLLSGVKLERGWVGSREMTPDETGLVGPIVDAPGLWVAAGFSGHGFMQSPVIGREVSAWLLDGSPSIDLAGMDPNRFARERLNHESLTF